MKVAYGWPAIIVANLMWVALVSAQEPAQEPAQEAVQDAAQENAQEPSAEAEPAEPAAVDGFVEPKPGQLRPSGGWYLGVYGTYTPTGMLLTQVYPGTAADRVGLEVGDRIVAVNGHQLGVVLGTRVTLDRALQRHANLSGWVRLLVQDVRTDQLTNVDVRLTRGQVHF